MRREEDQKQEKESGIEKESIGSERIDHQQEIIPAETTTERPEKSLPSAGEEDREAETARNEDGRRQEPDGHNANLSLGAAAITISLESPKEGENRAQGERERGRDDTSHTRNIRRRWGR